jgi:hypothetical protein
MAKLDDFQPPESEHQIDRLNWATDCMWDIAEGILSPAHAGILWAWIVGWADLATPDERAAYYGLASRVQELQQALLQQ